MLHSLYVQCLKIHLIKLISLKKQHARREFSLQCCIGRAISLQNKLIAAPNSNPHILVQIKRLVHIITQMILEKN